MLRYRLQEHATRRPEGWQGDKLKLPRRHYEAGDGVGQRKSRRRAGEAREADRPNACPNSELMKRLTHGVATAG